MQEEDGDDDDIDEDVAMFQGISGLCDEHFDKDCDGVHDGEDDSDNDGGDNDYDDVDEPADQVRGIGGLRAGRQVH